MKKIVEWQEKITDSGIQIADGPTTSTRRGEIIGATSLPVQAPNGMNGVMTILTVVRFPDNVIIALPAEACKIVDETPEPLRKIKPIFE